MKKKITESCKKRAREMRLFKHLNEMEKLKNYNNDQNFSASDKSYLTSSDIAQLIRENFNVMTLEEKKTILAKCMSVNRVNKELLEFELQHYKQKPQEMTLNKFKKCALKIFDRYQWRAGGFLIEDREWTVHTDTSKHYDVRQGELLFVNSVSNADEDDNETSTYLKRLLHLLNTLCANIKVELRYQHPKKDGIDWILIWCTDKNIASEDIPVSL